MENKSPTDILRKEHEKVLEILDSLEKNLGQGDIKSSEKNILLLEKEFDRHSLNKEEKALFPEIEKFIPREGGPTGVMILEHRELTEYIKNFKMHLKSKDMEKLNENGKSIINLLRQHIDKENNILFMIADMHLSDKQKKAILEKFREIDSGRE